MIKAFKTLIDRTTMYRLVLYYLLTLFAAAVLLGAFGVLPYAPLVLLYGTGVLLAAAWASNELLARFFGAATNFESAIITALILALILPPLAVTGTGGIAAFAIIAAVAMVSKYLLSIGKKHLFNPAAFAVVFSAFALGIPATWWIGGNSVLLALVILGGLLVVYKLRRFDLVLAFSAAALGTIALTSFDPFAAVQGTLLHSAFFFLAFVMLTEPLTMPPTRRLRILYGALVGVLFAPAAHIGSFYFSPELGLLAGNAFAYLVSPKGRYTFTLIERHKLARGIYEFVFRPDHRLDFAPGQYLEWTLAKVPFDSRGNRRYFTIASAPQEENVRLGVRFYDAPSAFKRALAALPRGGVVSGASLAGEFTLPKDKKRKLAFIAGGVGITPFASMARHLVFSGESRDAVLLYASRTASEVAYQDVFARAAREGLRTVYALTAETPLLPGAHAGMVDAPLIKSEIPDYRERLFYLSGPPGMVSSMKRILLSLGVSRFSIKTDYFPGLA
ncbi:MAG: FAD-dependent oxidoreductase [Minisyncoccota bacterium]